ncbi:MAG: methionyl-tRNA formyltransferase, partial [Candidatus Moranbacteria bacterium]|nr:methionyl-tRNA formyltransferase [Candidatus Moranbacteria bacterium]
IPKHGCINVHGSLLPRYRGAAPINWAILNGESETGVSVIQMNARMDAGDVLGQVRVAIEPRDTSVMLRQKMIAAGLRLLPRVINLIDQGKVVPVGQDEELATFAPKLTKDLGRVDWSDTAENIVNKIRGLQPWPGAYVLSYGKILKLVSARIGDVNASGRPGEILDIGQKK